MENQIALKAKIISDLQDMGDNYEEEEKKALDKGEEEKMVVAQHYSA